MSSQNKFRRLLLSLAAVILGLNFSGCSMLQPRVQVKEVMPALPASLLLECPDYQQADSDDVGEILRKHILNMEAANKCKLIHNALVGRIKELQQK